MDTLKRQHSTLVLHPQTDSIEPPSCKRIKLTPINDVVDDHPRKAVDVDHPIEPPSCELTIELTPRNVVVADPQKKAAAFENLLNEKKLSLVLDLDCTLLHSMLLARFTPQNRDMVLKETDDPEHSRSLFRVKLTEEEDFVTKLRPGLQHFLQEASKLFQLHVFTKGTRNYAMELLNIIDPENVYFGCKSSPSRVFTRENCIVGKKSLDLVIGKESGILIIDDKKRVWRDVDKENVLQIPKYNFFELGGEPGLVEGGDESDTEGLFPLHFLVFVLILAKLKI